MKRKMIFALLLAGMSFLAPNILDAQVACSSACGGGSIVSCTGTVSCTATSDGVACANAPGRGVTIKRCPKVVAEA